MKKDTHPTYYPKAKIKCACGTTYNIGATKPEINVEICSHCHPFFTGKEKLLDIAGKLERFKARREKAAAAAHKKVKKARVKKNKKK